MRFEGLYSGFKWIRICSLFFLGYVRVLVMLNSRESQGFEGAAFFFFAW